MTSRSEPADIGQFICAIQRLPSDRRVPDGTPGYNEYNTQKDHWLGWLDVDSGHGSYIRQAGPDRGARYVYNHVVEPKMLLWLIEAAGIRQELVNAAKKSASDAHGLASQAAAIRKHVPWPEVATALWGRPPVGP